MRLTWLGRQSSVQLSDTLTMRLMVSTLSESIGHACSFSLSGPTGCWWAYFTHNSFVLVIYGITQFKFRRYRFVFIFLKKQIIGWSKIFQRKRTKLLKTTLEKKTRKKTTVSFLPGIWWSKIFIQLLLLRFG